MLNVHYSFKEHQIILRLDRPHNCMLDKNKKILKLLSPSNLKVSLKKAHQTPWKRRHSSHPLGDLDFKIIKVLGCFVLISLFIFCYIMCKWLHSCIRKRQQSCGADNLSWFKYNILLKFIDVLYGYLKWNFVKLNRIYYLVFAILKRW